MKAPFPWFGGKSRVSHLVWQRFGNVANYVEPFAGSLAVLLDRPGTPGTETVNDADCYLANFWRALTLAPEETAAWCDWPVNEADLHARHLWLVKQTKFCERMKTDPEFFDPQIAGWWVWGISQWIGSGWCSMPEWTGRTNAGRADRGIHRKIPQLGDAGRGTAAKSLAHKRPMIHGGHTGKGVHQQIPHLSHSQGVHKTSLQIPRLGDAGTGVHAKRPNLSGRGSGKGIHGDETYSALYAYFEALAARLRRVRVCCGDWSRVLGPSVTVKHGVCGVFLDPPYDMRIVEEKTRKAAGLYAGGHSNDISKEVGQWARENGENSSLRIALCGYEGEHEMPENWQCVPWKAAGGYGSQRAGGPNENKHRERIWFSPHCLPMGLFEQAEFLEEE